MPGRTDFRFQRMSLMLPLEWALTGGRSRVVQGVEGIDTGDARRFAASRTSGTPGAANST